MIIKRREKSICASVELTKDKVQYFDELGLISDYTAGMWINIFPRTYNLSYFCRYIVRQQQQIRTLINLNQTL